jgi:adenosylhomocysteine nucleosidase
MKIALFSAFPQELWHIIKNVRPVSLIDKGRVELYSATCLSHEITMVVTGMGTKNARGALDYVLSRQTPDLLLSIGFGGALYEGAAIGDLVAADRVFLVAHDMADFIEPQREDRLLTGLSSKVTLREGTFFTLEKWMKKRDLRAIIDPAVALPVSDMETFPLAKGACERKIRFLAIRSITDLADEEIAPEMLDVTDESGHYRASRTLGLLFRRPALIPQGARLGFRSRSASLKLWHLFEALLNLL